MTTLLLIRHGESEANLKKLFAGFSDYQLTDLGRRQAEMTAEYIAEHYSVDAVYASDLKRAYCTGKTVAERLGLPITARMGLREIYAGKWEGAAFESLRENWAELWSDWTEHFERVECPEGESVMQLQQRVVNAVQEIALAHPDETVVIATHATPVRMLMSYCLDGGLGRVNEVEWVSNASVTELRSDGERLSLVRAGIDDHLQGFTTSFVKDL